MYICHFTLITRGGSPFKPILFKQLLPLTHPADVLAHSHPLVVFCHPSASHTDSFLAERLTGRACGTQTLKFTSVWDTEGCDSVGIWWPGAGCRAALAFICSHVSVQANIHSSFTLWPPPKSCVTLIWYSTPTFSCTNYTLAERNVSTVVLTVIKYKRKKKAIKGDTNTCTPNKKLKVNLIWGLRQEQPVKLSCSRAPLHPSVPWQGNIA